MARPAKTTTTPATTDSPHPRPSKMEAVIALLRRSEGATLGEIIEATGWQPHSARAVLTGLRKKGHMLEKTRREDMTCYRIAKPA